MTYAEISDLIDENLASGNKIPAVKHREVEHALLDYIQANLSQSGDIKRIKCDLAYYNANFETDGLGKNLRLGWAQCNGNNGTDNLTGRVGIGFGTGYNTFSGTGGESTHTLTENEFPDHQHYNGMADDEVRIFVYGGVTQGLPGSATGTIQSENNAKTYQGKTSSVGGNQAHNNMQPYIIQLYIMKL